MAKTSLDRELRQEGLGIELQLQAVKLKWGLISFYEAVQGEIGETSAEATLAEICYRWVDRIIFSRGRWKERVYFLPAACDSSDRPPWLLVWDRSSELPRGVEGLCIEYDGLSMRSLEDAIRRTIGRSGGMLSARVWLLRHDEQPLLLLCARLFLDHRSLHRSTFLCAAKLPSLLEAAWQRWKMRRPDRPLCHQSEGDAVPAWKQVVRLAADGMRWLIWKERWMIETGIAYEHRPQPLRFTKRLCPPQGVIWADPFVLDIAGCRWLLYEELQFSNNRGYIAAMAMRGAEVMAQERKIVLVEPWHLSFPFVWREGDDLYLLPEANESRKLTLYKILDGNLSLRPCGPLISGIRLADANIVRHEGRLWLFAAAADHGASLNDALHLYWAEHVEGPWHPHKLNPVKVDASSARPAGAMWIEDGLVHRVAQDCSSTYGGSVRCMRVTLLTEDDFEEQEVPGWSSAMDAGSGPWHTFNCAGELMVTDRLVATPRWWP